MEPAPLDLSPERWQEYYSSTGRTYVEFNLKGITDEYVGVITLELFTDICPKTCANFVSIVKGNGKHFYKGSPIHRVVKGGYIQGGDVVNGSGAGDPGYHIPDETYAVKHSAAGMLGMASTGQPHTAATQFYISLQPLNWLDGKMVAFGRAIGSRSFDTLRVVEDGEHFNERPVPEILVYSASVIHTGGP